MKTGTLLIALCISFFSTNLTGQQVNDHDTIIAKKHFEEGKLFFEEGKYQEAKDKFLQAKEIFSRATGIETLEVANCYYQLGRIFFAEGNYSQSLPFFQSALSIRIEKLSEKNSQVADLYYNIGNVYLNLGDFELSLKSHLKCIEISEKIISNRPSQQLSFSYGQTGFCLIELGDFIGAEFYFKKAIQMQEHNNNMHNGWLHGKLGYIYFCLYDYEKAIEYLEKGIFLIRDHSNSKTEVAWNKAITGNCFAEIGEFRKAENYLKDALQLWISYFGDNHLQVAQIYNDLGYLFFLEKEIEKAIFFHEKALNIRTGTPVISKAAIGQSYFNLGDCLFAQGKYEKAIIQYMKSYENRMLSIGNHHPFTLMCLLNVAKCHKKMGEFDRANYFLTKAAQALNAESFDPENLKNSAPNVVIQVLTEKIDLFYNWYLAIGIESHLLNAIKTANLADKFIDYYSIGYLDNTFFSLSRQRFFENATRAMVRLNKIDRKSEQYQFKEFHYSEKSKALLLYGLMQNSKAIQYSGIPDSLLKREYDLRKEITWQEKQRQGLKDRGLHETDTTVLRISSIIFDIRQEHDALKRHFETTYPEYYRAKYDLSVISVAETQQELLRPGEALLEYFVGDSAIFVFVVRPDTFAVLEIPNDFALDSLVTQLRHGIYGYYEANKLPALYAPTAQQYTEAATTLYDKLIAPVQHLLPKRLYIVPDGVLGYVPFETLLLRADEKPERFHLHHYFGQDHIISYAYSATLLREMRAKKHRKEPQGKVLAMAPFFRGDVRKLSESIASGEALLALRSDTLSALPDSGEEALRIAKAYKGKSLIGKEATKAAFEREASDYRILHLSTHGVADDRVGDYAWLGFAKPGAQDQFEKLYVRDIYNLSLNADLVVLSACQAGIGKLQRGEGIISLSRAFAYAGAKGIVTTLWSVEDKKTKDFMLAFYGHLRKMPAAEALWQTRRDFLTKRTGEAAHPYFWAGFIGVGDM